uniref:Alpha-1,3/1,6-mannosyltransferase ALG2 n=1 Tax=Anisakis simplex TaxID=6269 RepID=A0A0M3KG51_ANISI
LFRLFGLCQAPLFFYCHFPDLLLTDHQGFFKRLYRYVVDRLEGWSIGMADLICVNSNFTKGVVAETFPHLDATKLKVLYPTLNTKFFDSAPETELEDVPSSAKYLFVSINRYERKKNIKLAIDAFADNVKIELLRRSTAVLYTPSNEHFGIVPVEAMYMRSCVIAVNSGGPNESIENGSSGFLVESNARAFAEVMAKLVRGELNREEIGEAGRKRVQSLFTFEHFSRKLETLMQSLV